MTRFFRFKYNNQPFPPIDDNTAHTSMSLESALRPVLKLVDQLDYYIEQAKQLCHQPSQHGLTIEESAAVYIYSHEWSDQSLHNILSDALQSEDRTRIIPWLDFLRLFNSALDKLPTVTNNIWRGLPIELAEKFHQSDEIVCWGVISCSLSQEIIRSILNKDAVCCCIASLHGKDVRGYTHYNGDEEVLLLPGTRLQVKSKTSSGDMIYFGEISDVSTEQIPARDDIAMSSLSQSTDEENIVDTPDPVMNFASPTQERDNELESNSRQSDESKLLSIITFSNGDQYQVVHENGESQGGGIYCTINGEIFEGSIADRRANGEGICTFPNDDRFLGIFKHGRRCGHGILYDAAGIIHVGEWYDDKPVQQSLKILSNGNSYEWRDENARGRWYAVYHDDIGNKYIGDVIDGKPNGLGLRIWADDNRYEGNFKDDKKQGYGIYYYSDRDKYMGQWHDDEINGEGILTWNSGVYYRGTFVNGRRHGQGKLAFGNSQVQEGNWDNDEFVS